MLNEEAMTAEFNKFSRALYNLPEDERVEKLEQMNSQVQGIYCPFTAVLQSLN